MGAQRAAFGRLVRNLAGGSFWRDAGVRPAMTYDEFQTTVAPRGHEAFAAAIDRMRQGEANVLWPGRCQLFAATAGTTLGSAKLIPVTGEMLGHFHKSCRDAVLYYTARVGHAGVMRGKRLFVTGATGLTALHVEGSPHRAYSAEWPEIASLGFPSWARPELTGQGYSNAESPDWDARVASLIAGSAEKDISFVAGVPHWVLNFAEAMRTRQAELGRPVGNLRECWPNLECVMYGGCSAAPYQAELRANFGPGVELHEIYVAAEGVLAIQDGAGHGELRVLTHRGVYFEFVPLTDFDTCRTEALGPKAVTLENVATGVDYVVLITTPAGLARYVLGDIVRFTSVEPPRLIVVGRTDLRLTTYGERVLEKDVTDALLSVCQRHRWSIVNFHVAPLHSTALTGHTHGRHEWWVELKPGTMETPTGPQMALELDSELKRLNREYQSRRDSGRIDAPTVRLVMPGVFRHWQQFHGRWDGRSRIARCRGDRLVADELAQMTRFAGDQH